MGRGRSKEGGGRMKQHVSTKLLYHAGGTTCDKYGERGETDR